MYLLVQLIPSPSKPVLHSQCISPSVELIQVALMWHIVPLQVFAEIQSEKMFKFTNMKIFLIKLSNVLTGTVNTISIKSGVAFTHTIFSRIHTSSINVTHCTITTVCWNSKRKCLNLRTWKSSLLNYQTYLLVQLIPSPSNPVLHSHIPSSVEFTQVALMWHILPLQLFTKDIMEK